LGHVLGLRSAFEEVNGETIHAALMATDQEPKCLRVAFAGGGDKLSIGTLRQVLARGSNHANSPVERSR
jgi:hypothetical protein